jgi:DNA-binding CsgD family transcriptional regulator
MTLNDSQLEVLQHRRVSGHGEQRLNQLQADLVNVARIWARDEVGAAIAHELNEPMTALLLYLHAIEQAGETSSSLNGALTPMRAIVEKALREVERACNAIERMRQPIARPFEMQSAVRRGQEAIGAWAHGHSQMVNRTPPLSRSRQAVLTQRESEVLAQITSGASNKEGGRNLGISTRTFEVHRAHIMEKLGAKNAADLVRIALSENPAG